jgi:hypothetical protein
LSRLDEAAQQAAFDDMEEKLRAFNAGGEWIGPNELLLTAGQR